jgi:hypothetical protein
MRFTIFDAPSAGTQLWYETQADVPVASGLFSVELGAATALPASLFDTANLYLEIEVDLSGNSSFETNEKYSPRQHITSAAFAQNADELDALDSAQFLRSDADDTATSHIVFNDGLSWAARTGYVILKADAFVPSQETYKYSRATWYLKKEETTSHYYRAAIQLPHGATLQEMRVWFEDAVTEDITVYMGEWVPGSGMSKYIFGATSSGTPGKSYLDDTTPFSGTETVDNVNKCYYLRAEFPSGVTSDQLELHAVRITYATTGPGW